MSEAGEQIRLDKWLWFARFFKTRSIATKECKGRKIRINGTIIAKASATVRVGDVLTFPKAGHIRVIKILDLGVRRGPASEAALLFEDLAPPTASSEAEEGATGKAPARPKGMGRPTKADRRAFDKLRSRE
ncbi:hypothetical protein GCM10017044_05730 [Kordiimonas sediminis]|uniref:RNA-binding S4 domain-containing protein n=1 Tax=Kordiimonas sediminis TaxID=1735581 RepID=A0A919ALN9_9PROT|nr:RNA-binding S4 domain-containing protein [Kordiimonas sediminis]GHF14488.1 hypothetical protein GCM10017044_05730 [Kordiimonas sediminis]